MVAQKKAVDIHIQDYCEDKARTGDSGFAIAFALLEMAAAQKATTQALVKLGNNNADTRMGAIEMLAYEVKQVGEAISSIAQALPEQE